MLENGGYVYNPTTIAQYGLQEWGCYKASQSPQALATVINVANWLVDEQDSVSGSFLYTWGFQYSVIGMGAGSLDAPWASALAQGQAISLLLRAYNTTGNSLYLTAAENATKPLTQSVANGGLVDTFQGHPVYEEYPTTPPSFVLNGFMFTLIGLYDLAPYYAPAQQLYDQGMQSLDFILPYYDLADTTSYHLGRFTRSPSAVVFAGTYQAIHVEELRLLETITLPGDMIVPFYANLWCNYIVPGTLTLPALITPTPSTTLTGSSVNFAWNPGVGATSFEFKLGTSPGAEDVYNGQPTTGTSVSLSNIPINGATLYVRLYYLLYGTWQYINYSYKEQGTVILPALTTPTPSTTLTGSSVNFAWNPGVGATSFEFKLGTSPGAEDVYNGQPTTGTSVSLSDIPTNGATLFARLYYELKGTWQYINYTYKEQGTVILPALTTPTPSSTLTGSSVYFAWNPGVGATSFEFKLGTSPGAEDVYNGQPTTGTSVSLSDIPTNGATLFARLYYELNGTWQYINYTYKEQGTVTLPALTSPTPSSTLIGTTNLTFSWNPGVGAAQFEFRLGTSGPGANNLYDGGPVTGSSVQVPTIPGNGEPLYARLYYELNGTWNYIDYVYSTFNSFEPYAGNPILPVTDISSTETLTGFASVVKNGSTYYMYFSYYNAGGNFEIGLATSSDGLNWVADSADNPVLSPTGIPNWDGYWVRVPNVWLENGTWYMLYSGVSNTIEYRGGLATSSDGIHWTRSSVNNCAGTTGPGCVLDIGIQPGGTDKVEPCFGPMKVGSVYYLTYSSLNLPRQIGMATSTDLTTWTKDPANPILSGNRFCSDLFKYGSEYYLAVPHYTSGTNYTDFNTADFELYEDALPTFHPADATYLGIIKTTSATGFDDTDLDTPFVLTDDIYRDSYKLTDGDIWMYYSGATGFNPNKIWQEGLLISKKPSSTE